jgi:hypothetical protein
MKEKILDILEKHYHGRNHIESRCADELLDLLPTDDAKDKLLIRAAKGIRWLMENNDNYDAEVIDLLHTLEQEENADA